MLKSRAASYFRAGAIMEVRYTLLAFGSLVKLVMVTVIVPEKEQRDGEVYVPPTQV